MPSKSPTRKDAKRASPPSGASRPSRPASGASKANSESGGAASASPSSAPGSTLTCFDAWAGRSSGPAGRFRLVADAGHGDLVERRRRRGRRLRRDLGRHGHVVHVPVAREHARRAGEGRVGAHGHGVGPLDRDLVEAEGVAVDRLARDDAVDDAVVVVEGLGLYVREAVLREVRQELARHVAPRQLDARPLRPRRRRGARAVREREALDGEEPATGAVRIAPACISAHPRADDCPAPSRRARARGTFPEPPGRGKTRASNGAPTSWSGAMRPPLGSAKS